MPITARLREIVFLRDAWAVWDMSEERIHHGVTFDRFLRMKRHRPLCLTERVLPRASQKCSGRWTLEHVKCNLGMAMKAWDREDEPCPQCRRDGRYHLVVLCEYHNVWNPPSKELRQVLRAYLTKAGDYEARALEASGGDEPSMERGWNLWNQARR